MLVLKAANLFVALTLCLTLFMAPVAAADPVTDTLSALPLGDLPLSLEQLSTLLGEDGGLVPSSLENPLAATAASPTAAILPELDIWYWIDGERIRGTIGLPVQTSNAAMQLIPAATGGLAFVAAITPLTSGTHRVGIGFGPEFVSVESPPSLNFGLEYEIDSTVPFGQNIYALVEFMETSPLELAASTNSLCSDEVRITIQSDPGNVVTAIVVSKGVHFDSEDGSSEMFVRARINRELVAYPYLLQQYAAVYDTCEELSTFEIPHIPVELIAFDFKIKGYWGSIYGLHEFNPSNQIWISERDYQGFDYGLRVDVPFGASGDIHGKIYSHWSLKNELLGLSEQYSFDVHLNDVHKVDLRFQRDDSRIWPDAEIQVGIGMRSTSGHATARITDYVVNQFDIEVYPTGDFLGELKFKNTYVKPIVGDIINDQTLSTNECGRVELNGGKDLSIKECHENHPGFVPEDCRDFVSCHAGNTNGVVGTVIGVALLPAAVALLAAAIVLECATNPEFYLCAPAHDCLSGASQSACDPIIQCVPDLALTSAAAQATTNACQPVYDCISNADGNDCELVWFYVDYAQRCSTLADPSTVCYEVQQVIADCLENQEPGGTCFLVHYYADYAERCSRIEPGTVCHYYPNTVRQLVEDCLAGKYQCGPVLNLVHDCVGPTIPIGGQEGEEGLCSTAGRIVDECLEGRDPQFANVCAPLYTLLGQLVACSNLEPSTPCGDAMQLITDCLDQGEWRQDPCQAVWDLYQSAQDCAEFNAETPCGQAYQTVQACLDGSNSNCRAVLDIVADCTDAGAINLASRARAGTNGPCSEVLATLAECTSGAMSPCDTLVECASDVAECSHYQDYIRNVCDGPNANDCASAVLATVNGAVATANELVAGLCGDQVAMSAEQRSAQSECTAVVLQTVTVWVNFAMRTVNDACGGSTATCDDEVTGLADPLLAAVVTLVGNTCAGSTTANSQTSAPFAAAPAAAGDGCVQEALDAAGPWIATAQSLVRDLCPGSAVQCVNGYTPVVMAIVSLVLNQAPSTGDLQELIRSELPEAPTLAELLQLVDVSDVPDLNELTRSLGDVDPPATPALLQLLVTLIQNMTRNLT